MQNTIPSLETVTAKDLLTRPITPLGFTVSEILPHGIFILGGDSKIGKSWLALDICCAVADGTQLWQYPATRGDALYLALEDNHQRLQERLNKVSPVCDIDASTDVHFVTRAQKLDDGLSEQITEFLNAYPQTKLIVIDTLQYIRSSCGTYSGDYRDMDALREIIAGRDLTLLLITHTHKSGSDDPVHRIHGSAGLTGAVDGIFVLNKKKRTDDNATLTIANRDTESFEFNLRFNKTNCRWLFISDAKVEDNEDEYLAELLNLLLDETPTWRGTATELVNALKMFDPAFSMSPIMLPKFLHSREEYLWERHRIECKFGRNRNARFIELSREIIVVDD